MHLYRGFLLIFMSGIVVLTSMVSSPRVVTAQQNQRLVESVDITGNRRLRKDDILYYVQTRPGDPYNPTQVERDLQAVLNLGFFDKTATRVLTEDGARGGVNVIFEVKELPIIRDLQFEGLKSVPESDVLKAFRERRVGISKESIYDPVKARNAIRVLKELLAAHGHPNATVEEKRDEVSATSTALTFVINEGDIANGEKIGKALFENLKKYYGQQGFIEYTAEPTPTFKDNPQKPDEGIVDFVITIEEGKQFSLRRLEFVGNTFTRDNVLRREVLLNEGDIYNQTAWEYSIIKLNQLGYFDPIDKDKDADFKTNEEEATVDLNLKVSERGRQQISFNGGLSGIGGSFFGLEYSTNNLLGRGEILSLNMSAGNRQKYLQFSFTEPYIKNRPITAGFSLFGYTQKFFGEGTFLSQNVAAQQGLSGSQLDFLNVSEENLFTRTSYGGSLFASAPLSEFYRKRRFTQFSRVGLSYQFSTSSVTDPKVNEDPNNPTRFIPVVYSQPNIITSRVTGSFAYDTRNASIDPTQGRELSVQLAFAGLGGDVRTYQPTLTYSQFIPIRHKRSERPEVFGFRFIAGTVGSFATSSKVRGANSLAFVDGVPIFERFFLGDEFSIRGYNVRSISPLAPLDTYVSSRNVVLASNPSGTPTVIPGVPSSLANVGVFTGVSGSNSVQLPRSF